MKKLDVSQLLELCTDVGVENRHELSQTLLNTLDQLAAGAARKLGVACGGVEYGHHGVLVAFGPLAPLDPCPAVLASLDDEGVWCDRPQSTLLICDDDHNQTLLARRALASLGVRVIETHSAEEAWQAYQANEVNLVIADSALPDEDGFALLKKIVACEGRRGGRRCVPIITISKDADATNVIDAESVGRVGSVVHLNKPLDWSQLGPVIRELCHAF
ncbi:MAG: response regulator [Pseudomonadales bacterium]|nr:response regulator [Pseudomonadales bacterium]